MKKCRTCKHWTYSGFNSGKCVGIFPKSIIIEKPSGKKGEKRGQLIVSPGICIPFTNGNNKDFVFTESNWCCANWKRVH